MWDVNEIEREGKLVLALFSIPLLLMEVVGLWGFLFVFFSFLLFSKMGRWHMKQYLVNIFVDA